MFHLLETIMSPLLGLLRTLISSPRIRHHDPHTKTSLDLCHLTPQIIVMSMPAPSFPRTLYRNPLRDVQRYLEGTYGDRYTVWEFRAEGAEYVDEDFGGRVLHYPFVDHHPPPFSLLPAIVESLHGHLDSSEKNVAVLHCKAGKGRSGTAACAYLIAYKSHTAHDAMELFTAKRMKPGWGNGISIRSQRRYLQYVEQWQGNGRRYVEGWVRVKKVMVYGGVKGLKVSVAVFGEEGREIKSIHDFTHPETSTDTALSTHVYVPSTDLVCPTDICLKIDHHSFFGLVQTTMSHAWFNTYFESDAAGVEEKEGRYEVDWLNMDGWKGTKSRGRKVFERVVVEWEVVDDVVDSVLG
ncbi:Telomerase protein component 1 [Saitoella coloradoensis]